MHRSLRKIENCCLKVRPPVSEWAFLLKGWSLGQEIDWHNQMNFQIIHLWGSLECQVCTTAREVLFILLTRRNQFSLPGPFMLLRQTDTLNKMVQLTLKIKSLSYQSLLKKSNSTPKTLFNCIYQYKDRGQAVLLGQKKYLCLQKTPLVPSDVISR